MFRTTILLGGDDVQTLQARRSERGPMPPPKLPAPNAMKSDMQIYTRSGDSKSITSFKTPRKERLKEFYTRYEHDEVPVKEFSSSEYAYGDNKSRLTLTDSLLEQIEQKVLKNRSQELQTDSSEISEESYLKIFKTTVQEIFDTFYTTLKDIESLKKRYHEILNKSKPEQIESEMQSFIKEIIQRIKSNDTMRSDETPEQFFSDERIEPTNEESITEVKSSVEEPDAEPTPTKVQSDTEEKPTKKESNGSAPGSVYQTYKNSKYVLDSNGDNTDVDSTPKQQQPNEILNIYFVNATPSVEIRVTDRQLLSEVNIKSQFSADQSRVISAENMKKIEKKIKELENLNKMRNEQEHYDREIPIKNSIPKKDLFLNEDFQCDVDKTEKSIIQKLCSYFCRKIRKTAS